MNALDSRFLRLGDCYARKFGKSGSVRYVLTVAAGHCMPVGDGAFTITVGPRPAKKETSRQHNVVVRLKNSVLVAEPPSLQIDAGDMILWHTPDAAAHGFAVVGEGDAGNFNSGALTDESVYTHAFGLPGLYDWVDAHGGKVRGQIRVKTVEAKEPNDCKKWLETLGKGSLITINGEKAEPKQIDILAGQTVFWAVQKAPGISITDAKLLLHKSFAKTEAPAKKGKRR
jgi:plastocyanin